MLTKIMGIVGFIGSGKGTVGDILAEKYGFRKDSFAGPVKDACSVLFGWDRKLLEGDTDESREFRERVDTFWSNALDWPNFTPRVAMQYMGTQAGRDVFGDPLWVSSLLKRFNDSQQNTVVTDVRFPNEIDAIRSAGGHVIWVRRGDDPVWYDQAQAYNYDMRSYGRTTIPEPDVHASERAWIGHPGIAHTIDNNGTLEDLNIQVEKVMKTFYT
jgi:hypothetical protein